MSTTLFQPRVRRGNEDVKLPTLGARLEPDQNGFRIDYIYQSDPDYPSELSPLADPDLNIKTGPFPFFAFEFDGSSMFLHDAPTNRKP